jgi:hypothetical protein
MSTHRTTASNERSLVSIGARILCDYRSDSDLRESGVQALRKVPMTGRVRPRAYPQIPSPMRRRPVARRPACMSKVAWRRTAASKPRRPYIPLCSSKVLQAERHEQLTSFDLALFVGREFLMIRQNEAERLSPVCRLNSDEPATRRCSRAQR